MGATGVAVALVTGFLTLYSMTKIWSYAFWRNQCHQVVGFNYRGMMAPTAILVVMTILMGLCAQPFLSLGQRTARSVLDPQGYIAAVLGSGDEEPVADTPLEVSEPSQDPMRLVWGQPKEHRR